MAVNREIASYPNTLTYLLNNLKAKQRGITIHSPSDPNNESTWDYSKGWVCFKDVDLDTHVLATQKYYDVSASTWIKSSNVFADIEVDQVYTDIGLRDQYLAADLPVSESGETALDGAFTATSIVGCLNELKNDIVSPNQFWKALTSDTVAPKDGDGYDWVYVNSGLKDQYCSGISLAETGEGSLDGAFTATSILGALNELITSIVANDTFIEHSDTPSSYTINRILFESGSAVIDSAELTYNTSLGVLEVKKDQNAVTEILVNNDTGGTLAYSQYRARTNSCTGTLAAYDDGYTANTFITNKIVLGASNGSGGLIISTGNTPEGDIDFVTNGTLLANLRAKINSSQIDFYVPYVYHVYSQDAQTHFEVRNTNTGSSAYSSVNVKGQGAEAILGAYSSSYSAQTEWQSKAVLSSTGYELVLVGTPTNGVEIYAGGTGSVNKSVRFMSSYTRMLKGLMIGDDSDPIGCWLHVKSPNESARFERTTNSIGNQAMGLLILKVTRTDSTTTDGFGGGFRFDFQDTVDSGYLAEVQGVRNGSGGDLVLGCSTTGSDMQKRMIIKSEGNVLINKAIGENWSSIYTVLQIGGQTAIYSTTAEGAGANTYIGTNIYMENGGVQKRFVNDEVTLYRQVNGQHYWYSLDAGTPDISDNPIVRMYLTNYNHGNNGAQLGVGTNTPMLNVCDVSGDFTGDGIHIHSDVANSRPAYLILEGDYDGTRGASIIFGDYNAQTANTHLFEMMWWSTTSSYFTIQSLNDNTTIKKKLITISETMIDINPDGDTNLDWQVRSSSYQYGLAVDSGNNYVISQAIANYNIYGETNLQPVYIDTDNGRMGYYAPP